MDFHVHLVCRTSRVHIEDRLIGSAVNEPADAVGRNCVCCIDKPLDMRSTGNGGQVDMIRAVYEIGDYVEIARARGVREILKHERIIPSTTGQRVVPATAIDYVVATLALECVVIGV